MKLLDGLINSKKKSTHIFRWNVMNKGHTYRETFEGDFIVKSI